MTAHNFMNVVRFKLKSDCVDKYFEVIDKTNFEGMTQRYIAQTEKRITVLLVFGKRRSISSSKTSYDCSP